MQKIWVPETHMHKQLIPLQRALHEYDDRLIFGRNEVNGDWVIFYQAERDNLVPVLGFQNTIPTVDDMLARVRAADTKRHTNWLEENVHKPNEELRKAKGEQAEEASWLMAEGMESFLHGQGKTPYKRIFNKATESRRSGGQHAR